MAQVRPKAGFHHNGPLYNGVELEGMMQTLPFPLEESRTGQVNKKGRVPKERRLVRAVLRWP